MKKKIFVLLLVLVSIFPFSACGKEKINISNYLIEEREHLFTANDDLYNVSLSSGKREVNYNLDGVVNELTDFAILTLYRNDFKSLANDTYSYVVTINNENLTGFLKKNEIDNLYSTDLEIAIPADATINVKISFTGYSFNKDLVNTSRDFAVDKNTALNLANNELIKDVENIVSDGSKIEVVTKILKDHSSPELKNYYWYIGVISTNGETLGLLIDANSGDVIAKKV